jgi:hypothetical protein
MFGLFRPRAEKLALKVERLIMSAEMAFDRGKVDTAAAAYQVMLPVLRNLHHEGWSEQRLFDFLRERGLCKSTLDKAYEARMRSAIEQHMYAAR